MAREQHLSLYEQLTKVERSLKRTETISRGIINQLQNPEPNPLHPHLDLTSSDSLVPHYRHVVILDRLQSNAIPHLEEQRQVIRNNIVTDIAQTLERLPVVPSQLGKTILERVGETPLSIPEDQGNLIPPIADTLPSPVHALNENLDGNRDLVVERMRDSLTLPQQTLAFMRLHGNIDRTAVRDALYPGEGDAANHKFDQVYIRAVHMLPPDEEVVKRDGKISIRKKQREYNETSEKRNDQEIPDGTRESDSSLTDTSIPLIVATPVVSERIDGIVFSTGMPHDGNHVHQPSPIHNPANGTKTEATIQVDALPVVTDIYVAAPVRSAKTDEIHFGYFSDKPVDTDREKEVRAARRNLLGSQFTRLVLSHLAVEGNIDRLTDNPLGTLQQQSASLQAVLGDGVSKSDLRQELVIQAVRTVEELWERKIRECTSDKEFAAVNLCRRIQTKHRLTKEEVAQRIYAHFGVDSRQLTLH